MLAQHGLETVRDLLYYYPREYLDRLEYWQNRIESGGGTWRVINDMDRLERILTQ